MEQILALLEQDKSYCERFSKYASSRSECPFTVYTFQSSEELRRFAAQNPIELLLANADPQEKTALQSLPVHSMIELSEEPPVRTDPRHAGLEEAPNRIYKYQSGENILRELVSGYQCRKKPAEAPKQQGTARLFMVYSPIGRSGKTAFAESLARILPKDMKTLYLSFEEVSSRTSLYTENAACTLSDALYFFMQNRLDSERLSSMIMHVQDVALIPPVRSPEDIASIKPEELLRFLQHVRMHAGYDAVVVDTDSLLTRVEALLPEADWIFMPVTEEAAPHRKLAAFEQHMSASSHRAVLDRIVKLVVPVPHPESGTSEDPRLSEFTSAVIRNYIYDEKPRKAVSYEP